MSSVPVPINQEPVTKNRARSAGSIPRPAFPANMPSPDPETDLEPDKEGGITQDLCGFPHDEAH